MDAEARGRSVDLGMRQRPESETVAFGKLVVALATMRAKDPLVPFQVDVYEDATVDVPLMVLSRAVGDYLKSHQWRPTVQELLMACEATRLKIRGAMKFEPCANCSKDGWTEQVINGVSRMVRCQCWKVHQERVSAIGAGDAPLTLPAGDDGGAIQEMRQLSAGSE